MTADEAVKLPTERKDRQWLETAASYAAVAGAALVGVLIRLGLEWIGSFAVAQVFPVIWPQIIGCFIMGVVVTNKAVIEATSRPLFAALGTGLCGTITTFSSWMSDVFLAFANIDRPALGRFNGFMNGLANTVVTLSMSIAFLLLGFAFKLRQAKTSSSRSGSKNEHIITIAACLLLYVGGVLITALAPAEWRGRVTFALIFAPPGALLRFELSRQLNTRVPRFPLGTFAANMSACVVFAITALFARRRPVSFVTCAALKGLEDGFSGGLSTVSTFVVELDKLKKRDAVIYGLASWVCGQLLFVLILGVPIWTGTSPYPYCATET